MGGGCIRLGTLGNGVHLGTSLGTSYHGGCTCIRFPNPRLPHEVCDEKWVMLEEKISGELGCIGLKYQRKEFKLLKWKCFIYYDDDPVDW